MNMVKLGLSFGICSFLFYFPDMTHAERVVRSEPSSDSSSKLMDELIEIDTARSLMLASLHTTSTDPSSDRSALLQHASDKNPNHPLINALIMFSRTNGCRLA